MFHLYVKQLVAGEENKYGYLHLEAETDEEREAKRAQYLEDGWEETTKEEWEENFENRKGGELDGNPEAQLEAAKAAGTLSGVDAENATQGVGQDAPSEEQSS